MSVLCWNPYDVDHCLALLKYHYCDVIMSAMACRLFTQPFIQVQLKENIKAPRHWPLWGEFPGDRWIPSTKAGNAETVSIRWRQHGQCNLRQVILHLLTIKGSPLKYDTTCKRLLKKHLSTHTCKSPESLSNSIGYKRSVFILLPILFSEALFVHVTIISYFVYHGRFLQLFTTSGVGFTSRYKTSHCWD